MIIGSLLADQARFSEKNVGLEQDFKSKEKLGFSKQTKR